MIPVIIVKSQTLTYVFECVWTLTSRLLVVCAGPKLKKNKNMRPDAGLLGFNFSATVSYNTGMSLFCRIVPQNNKLQKLVVLPGVENESFNWHKISFFPV